MKEYEEERQGQKGKLSIHRYRDKRGRVRLDSGNDDFHDEQEGRVYVHGVSSLQSKSEVIRNNNGNVTVKSEG